MTNIVLQFLRQRLMADSWIRNMIRGFVQKIQLDQK